MKYLALLPFVCYCLLASAQQQHAWLPEAYIIQVKNRVENAEASLFPISAIINPFKDCSIIAYRSEIRTVRVKKIIINGQGKREIRDIEYCFNLSENSKEAVGKLAKSKVYFYKINNEKLLLEIVHNNKIDSIYFTDHFKDYRFEGFYDSIEYLNTIK